MTLYGLETDYLDSRRLRGLRIAVGPIVELIVNGRSRERILQSYPQIEEADILESLAHAARRMEEREKALVLN